MYQLDTTCPTAISSWFTWMAGHFHNCQYENLPIFQLGDTCSQIDYIMCHKLFHTQFTNADIHYLSEAWTDHSLLFVDLIPSNKNIGPGSWRFNPSFLLDSQFTELLQYTVEKFFTSYTDLTVSSTQDQWELLKSIIKCTAQSYSNNSKAKYKHKIDNLQLQRQSVLSSHMIVPKNLSSSQLDPLEKQIADEIQKETYQCMLRYATRWHESGERNNKYFFRVIKERQLQQTLIALKCPSTGIIFKETSEILRETRILYQNIYTPENIDNTAINSPLANIPSSVTLSSEQATKLTNPPAALDIL